MHSMVRGKWFAAVVAVVALMALVSTAGAAPLGQASDSVTVADQPIVGGSITLQEVKASKAGWIAVHLDEGGSAGRVIGHGAVKQGTNANLKVTLDETVPVGGKVWPMLHVDAGAIGTYEFPGPDAPVVVDGNVVMKQITITEAPASATPAATPTTMPPTGGSDVPLALWIGALALVALGALVRFRRQA
jgi:LPXTG-motif cell wall-anchored protein